MTIRTISLEGSFNFRDLGGYPTRDGGQTRYGLIYRSATLCHLTDNDRLTLTELGLRASFDLRSDAERDASGWDQVGENIEVIHMPTSIAGIKGGTLQKVFADPLNFRLQTLYIEGFAERAAYHAQLFRAVTDPAKLPAVIHCSAGKDRTGVIVALLLRVAGVSDEDIITDYAETALYTTHYEKDRASYIKSGLPAEAVDELFSARAETMASLLAHMDETFTNTENYLIQGGLDIREIEAFREMYVEKRGA